MVAAGAAVTYAHKPLEHGQRGQLQLALVFTVVLVGLFLGAMSINWLPAINTALLLASAATLTWAHWSIRNGNRGQFNLFLAITIVLGVVFLGCQATEYTHAYHEGLKLSSRHLWLDVFHDDGISRPARDDRRHHAHGHAVPLARRPFHG